MESTEAKIEQATLKAKLEKSGCALILGSSSKWRKEVLSGMGFNFSCISPDIDEKAIRDPSAEKLTTMIARAKMEEILNILKKKGEDKDKIIITSDQVIRWNGLIREKPVDEKECREFLRGYKDHPAECVGSVIIHNTTTGKQLEATDIAVQHFYEISEQKMTELIAQGDVMYCCGGFTIEHMPECLKKREGEEEAIKGLPKTLLLKLLSQIL